jgi:hypothetical protein
LRLNRELNWHFRSSFGSGVPVPYYTFRLLD